MKKILIVDDRENTRQAISLCLRLHGYQTVQAHHGREAVKMVDKGDIALVLMDLLMPVMNGPEAAGRIRQRHADLPMIFMSSYDQTKLISEEFSGRCLNKPFPAEELLDEIARQLSPPEEVAG